MSMFCANQSVVVQQPLTVLYQLKIMFVKKEALKLAVRSQ
jgi:hypothetical protein